MEDYKNYFLSTKQREIISENSFLVTGGAGFIGSHIVDFLLTNGAKKVRVLDNLSTGFKKNINPFEGNSRFEFFHGDIRDHSTCRQACEGITYVSHQAALGSVPRSIDDPVTSNEVNINGHLNMLVASRDAKVRKMVYAASSSTYGDSIELPKKEDIIGSPLSPYAVTKYVNELYASVFYRVYRFPSIGLRYFNVFGPRQNPKGAYAAVIPLFMEAVFSGTPPYINGDGEQTRDFTYVDNAVQANILAMLTENNAANNQVYNIACGENISLNSLFETLRSIAGVDGLQPLYREARIGDVRNSLADISKAKKLFGYNPSVKVVEGLTITYNLWQKNG